MSIQKKGRNYILTYLIHVKNPLKPAYRKQLN